VPWDRSLSRFVWSHFGLGRKPNTTVPLLRISSSTFLRPAFCRAVRNSSRVVVLGVDIVIRSDTRCRGWMKKSDVGT
jgi:hypothetical protein